MFTESINEAGQIQCSSPSAIFSTCFPKTYNNFAEKKTTCALSQFLERSKRLEANRIQWAPSIRVWSLFRIFGTELEWQDPTGKLCNGPPETSAFISQDLPRLRSSAISLFSFGNLAREIKMKYTIHRGHIECCILPRRAGSDQRWNIPKLANNNSIWHRSRCLSDERFQSRCTHKSRSNLRKSRIKSDYRTPSQTSSMYVKVQNKRHCNTNEINNLLSVVFYEIRIIHRVILVTKEKSTRRLSKQVDLNRIRAIT